MRPVPDSGNGLRAQSPAARIAALADDGRFTPVTDDLAAPRPSPHLARWGIAAQDDDGVVVGRTRLQGALVFVAAQDERFLGGSIGAAHAAALRAMFLCAIAERPAAVVLLCASGGVRLHEANPAEFALGRAAAALIDARAAGIPVLALCVGDVFGGAAVLASAADRTGLLPRARLGVSGPRVITSARGSDELDCTDAGAVAALFGAQARSIAQQADLVADETTAVRDWIGAALRARLPFDDAVVARHAELGRALDASLAGAGPGAWHLPPAWLAIAEVVDARGGLWKLRDRPVWLTGARGHQALRAPDVFAQDTALLQHVVPAAEARTPVTLIVVEDSLGHDISRAAEQVGIARYLAHHAAMLGLLRAAGARIVGVLSGLGHSAAFFANALQGGELHALASARVMAMDPRNVAKVTGLDQALLEACLETDPVLGQPVNAFGAWGGIAKVFPQLDAQALHEILEAG